MNPVEHIVRLESLPVHPCRRDVLLFQEADLPADEHVHQGPEENVGGKEDVYVDIVYQDDVQYEEPEGNPDDRMPGAADGHADGHELVMDMAAVRGEGAPPVENPVDEKPHHVQHRDQKDGEGIHEIVVPLVRRYGGMVCESGRLYGERRYDEAHGKGPRVPHEYLRLLLGGTVHVVDIEGQEGAESRCTQYCISGKPYLHEQDGKNSYSHDTQAGGKAVDGKMRILEKVPTAIHERTPLIIGSADDVDQVLDVYKECGKI